MKLKMKKKVKYKCGHYEEAVILNTSLMSLSNYNEWLTSVGLEGTREMCYNCWLKEIKNGKR